jgi:catechol 2,3-dioxygenase-like lactoylglutathione lyase family enzyme
MRSLYSVFIVPDVAAARRFYCEHFGMTAVFAATWYVQLHGPSPSIQLAFIAPGHGSVPAPFREDTASGALVSLEVEDARATADRLREADLSFVYPLTDEPWGQRHFILVDPNGLLVDVIELIEPDAAWYREHALPE